MGTKHRVVVGVYSCMYMNIAVDQYVMINT